MYVHLCNKEGGGGAKPSLAPGFDAYEEGPATTNIRD